MLRRGLSEGRVGLGPGEVAGIYVLFGAIGSFVTHSEVAIVM